MILACPAVDRLDRDGRTLLLFEDSFLEVSPLALELWEHAAQPTSVEDLTDHLVATFGAPLDASAHDLVHAIVQELLDHHALRQEAR